MSWKITPGPKFRSQLRDGALLAAAIELESRLKKSWPTLRAKIANLLGFTLEASDVIRALRGTHVTDLQAELGLSGELANALADGMVQMMDVGMEYSLDLSPQVITVRIRAVPKLWAAYRNLPGAQYISTNKAGFTAIIPVSDWLLVDPNIDVGQFAFDIMYAHQVGKIRFSGTRSGRAMMVPKEHLLFMGPYMLPAICQKQAGENFIEYTIGQPGVGQAVLEYLLGAL